MNALWQAIRNEAHRRALDAGSTLEMTMTVDEVEIICEKIEQLSAQVAHLQKQLKEAEERNGND